jgi:hypothetical protein
MVGRSMRVREGSPGAHVVCGGRWAAVCRVQWADMGKEET